MLVVLSCAQDSCNYAASRIVATVLTRGTAHNHAYKTLTRLGANATAITNWTVAISTGMMSNAAPFANIGCANTGPLFEFLVVAKTSNFCHEEVKFEFLSARDKIRIFVTKWSASATRKFVRSCHKILPDNLPPSCPSPDIDHGRPYTINNESHILRIFGSFECAIAAPNPGTVDRCNKKIKRRINHPPRS